MIRYFFLALMLVLIPGGAVFGMERETYVWPLPISDNVTTKHGQALPGGLYHIGIDAGSVLGANAPVFAIANGTVAEAQERTSFGLVVLIQHERADGTEIVSEYGHLNPNKNVVVPGQKVKQGEVIGFLGNSKNNGGWIPHLHFGISKQPYNGTWKYAGHVAKKNIKYQWYKPQKFIQKNLARDVLAPDVDIRKLLPDQIVDDELKFPLRVFDAGEGVQQTVVSLSHDQRNWQTIATSAAVVNLPLSVSQNISAYPVGDLYLQVMAVDFVGNRAVETLHLQKE